MRKSRDQGQSGLSSTRFTDPSWVVLEERKSDAGMVFWVLGKDAARPCNVNLELGWESSAGIVVVLRSECDNDSK
jgi:hypothetical protein